MGRQWHTIGNEWLTVFKSTFADFSSGSTVLLGGGAGTSGKLGLVSGFLW